MGIAGKTTMMQTPLSPRDGHRSHEVLVEHHNDPWKKIQISVWTTEDLAELVAIRWVVDRYRWPKRFLKARIITADGDSILPPVERDEHDAHSIGTFGETA